VLISYFSGDISSIVIIDEKNYYAVSSALDCSAQGIMVPQVIDPEEVKELVELTRHPSMKSLFFNESKLFRGDRKTDHLDSILTRDVSASLNSALFMLKGYSHEGR
jgi:hypothetical protein